MKVINYVSFIHPVSIGGDIHSIQSYQRDRHANAMDVADKGPWLVLSLKGAQAGQVRRVPMSNVIFISDIEVEEPKK